MGETQKLETDTGMAGLTETGEMWDFEWSSTKLDFGLQFVTQALETRLPPELEEKDETFNTEADATLDLHALGKKQEFCVEAVSNGKSASILKIVLPKLCDTFGKFRLVPALKQ